MVENASDFRRGDAHPEVILMGACPGRDEEAQGRPFAGAAGANLRVMLVTLRARQPKVFPSERLEDYTLLNAHDLPRYTGRPGYDGETVPSKEDVLNPENVERLREQIADVDATLVVYLGNDALAAHDALPGLFDQIRFFKVGHPSSSGWNRVAAYRGLAKQEKLERWAVDSWREL